MNSRQLQALKDILHISYLFGTEEQTESLKKRVEAAKQELQESNNE